MKKLLVLVMTALLGLALNSSGFSQPTHPEAKTEAKTEEKTKTKKKGHKHKSKVKKETKVEREHK